MRLAPFTRSRPSWLGGSDSNVAGSTILAATPGMGWPRRRAFRYRYLLPIASPDRTVTNEAPDDCYQVCQSFPTTSSNRPRRIQRHPGWRLVRFGKAFQSTLGTSKASKEIKPPYGVYAHMDWDLARKGPIQHINNAAGPFWNHFGPQHRHHIRGVKHKWPLQAHESDG